MSKKTSEKKPESSFYDKRVAKLESLGLSHTHSLVLAHTDMKISDIQKIINEGCPPYLAYKIYRPL